MQTALGRAASPSTWGKLLVITAVFASAVNPDHSIEALRRAVRRNHNLAENRTSGEAVEIVEEVEALLEELDAATDSHSETDCKCWAAQGQCEQNPGFMLSNCESSCARAMACALLLATAAWGRGEPASFALSAGESVGIEEQGGFENANSAHVLQGRLTLMKNVADARLQDCSKGAAATVTELTDVKRHRDELDADLHTTKASLEECEMHSRMRKQRLDELEMKLGLHQTSRDETVRHLEAEIRRREKVETEQDRKLHMAETRINSLEAQVQHLKATLQVYRNRPCTHCGGFQM